MKSGFSPSLWVQVSSWHLGFLAFLSCSLKCGFWSSQFMSLGPALDTETARAAFFLAGCWTLFSFEDAS